MLSGKYYVQQIDYKRFKISLSDAGVVVDTNCSFIPWYFLYDRSFNNVLFGEDNFESKLFILDPINPSRIAYFIGTVLVGCDFMVATLGVAQSEIVKEKVSYDEIHEMIVDGIEISWLPVICEDIDVEREQICHYAYQTTDKCGT